MFLYLSVSEKYEIIQEFHRPNILMTSLQLQQFEGRVSYQMINNSTQVGTECLGSA